MQFVRCVLGIKIPAAGSRGKGAAMFLGLSDLSVHAGSVILNCQ